RYWNRSVVRSILVPYLRTMLPSRKSLVKDDRTESLPTDTESSKRLVTTPGIHTLRFPIPGTSLLFHPRPFRPTPGGSVRAVGTAWCRSARLLRNGIAPLFSHLPPPSEQTARNVLDGK